MHAVTLSQAQVRAIVLHAAGLARRGQFGKGKDAVYKVIDHLGFLQIDTNYVVERAHHHMLAARIADYHPEWLGALQAEGKIYEFWTFAAGFMPMHEFRFSLPVKEAFAARYKTATPAETNLMRKILERIGRDGPLMARDFENDRVTKSTGWWDWRPSKVALERLHFDGRLMVTRRPDFQKVYDLPGNVLQPDTDTTRPTDTEYARHRIMRSLQALGVSYGNELLWSSRYSKLPVKAELARMVEEGKVSAVNVPGIKGTLYTLPAYVKKKITIAGDAFILSPFDILNVFRRRLRDFFGFDYQVECFVPEAKRKYGYFSLPVLIGDRFVARMDSKADRKQQQLIIHNLHIEKVKFTLAMQQQLAKVITEFARFNQCTEVSLTRCNNAAVAKNLRKLLNIGSGRRK